MIRKVPRIDISLNNIDEPKPMQKPYISNVGGRTRKLVKENTNHVRLSDSYSQKQQRLHTQPNEQSNTLKVRIRHLIQSISNDTP